MSEPRGALDGIRVVEWAHAHLGPGAGMFLADFGADVIHVERLGKGDLIRQMRSVWGVDFTLPGDRNAFVEDLERSKRGLAVDLAKAEGRDIVYRLVEKADVFITNMRIPAIEKNGMTYEILKQRNPKLLYCAANSYGDRGPERDAPGLEMTGLARGGMMLGSAPLGGEPVFPSIGLNDRLGAIGFAIGILTAILARERFGIAQEISTSQLGWMVNLQAVGAQIAANTGQDPRPPRREESNDPLYNYYRLQDGTWIALGMVIHHDRYWPRFCHGIGHPELLDDPRFATTATRTDNRRELIAVLDRIFAGMTFAEWDRIRVDNELIATRINQLTDLVSDPQVLANEYLVKQPHPELGEWWYVPTPLRFEKTPVSIRSAAPSIGEHTDAILRDELGLGDDDVSALRARGVI